MKKTISLLLAALLMFSLCACGSAKSDSASAGGYAAPAASEIYTEGSGASSYAEEADYGLAMLNSASADSSAAENASPDADTPELTPEKIIYSADVKVETTDFDGSISRVDELLAACGGWVESSSVNGANFYNITRGYASTRSASYTLRIPSSRFDELMNSLSALGNVPYTHTYTENVTAQYFDTEAHLKAYQTQEARLLEMMEIAESVEDIVTLEDRLTELRYRIESLQSTLKNWDRRVSYSTVYLSLQEVQEYTPEAEVKLSYGQRLWRSFSGGIKGAAAFFSELLVWLVGALPTLVILAAIVLILRPLFKKWSARRKEKKQRRSAPKTEVKTEDALK
ncbi:MAG: DUF4349 domain-containing protein [Oscillospiraceae bacterium]|nr:DUF4349 domain-containing protein [Oscillospiraceae bacterium]